MKAITLHQPHATLVALGVQTIVTTEHPTDHRGPLAIASSERKPTARTIGSFFVRFGELFQQTQPSGSWEAIPLPLCAVVATARLLDVVPIRTNNDAVEGEAEVVLGRLRPPNYTSTAPYPALLRVAAGESEFADISDQLPYADFTPGRWAWLLDDVKATTARCPRCWGRGSWGVYASALNPHCPLCDGNGTCPPIPWKGGPGLREWTP